jgi:hypothetical protein
MNIPDRPTKAVVSTLELCEMLGLSKSRFYALVQSGVFPKAIRNESCKRPVYDLELQQKCLETRRTGIDAEGRPIVFNRKRRANAQRQRSRPTTTTSDHADLIESLKSLGLQATSQAVESALAELYPNGRANVDEGEQVRQVFLHLQRKR